MGSDTIVEFLISNGAEVNAKSSMENYTPLHMASFDGHTSVAELLIASGADIHEKSTDGVTALDIATQHNHQSLVELLKKLTTEV